MKKKGLILNIIILILVILLGFILINNYIINKKIKEDKKLVENIKSHYNNYVITNKDTNLYKLENDQYIENGKISESIKLTLKDLKISIDTKYFYINELDSYIYFKDVEKIEEYKKSDRYKKYIYFNENITTNHTTSFYDKDDNLLYTLNKSYDFKVLVKDTDRYGVIFNEELVYIHSEDVKMIYDNQNTDLKNKSRIRTLTYHFMYDESYEKCDQWICLSLQKFREQLNYLKENNYLTLTMEELELYMDGKINIPENSVVLTIDDATIFNTYTINLLEEYEVNATLFVITSINEDFSYLKSEYLDLESHTENMHVQYACPGYGSQGGGILCLPEETVLEDLRISQEKIGGSKYFAYPFYDYSNRAIELLKKAGFNMAFIGQSDTDGYSYPGITDKYKLRRKTIFSSITMNEFISFVK